MKGDNAKYWDKPSETSKEGGYYNSGGYHQDLNAKMGVNPGGGYDAKANMKNWADQLAKQAKTGLLPGEDKPWHPPIRNARIPTDMTPGLRPEITDGGTGKIGLDEKLVEASRLAESGANGAYASSISLWGALIDFSFRCAFAGGGDYCTARDKINEEYGKYVGLAAMWKESKGWFDKGKRLLVRDYAVTNPAPNVSPVAPGAAAANNPGGSAGPLPPPVADAVAETKSTTSEATKAKIESMGIGFDDFVDKVASGEFASSEAMLEALGKTANITPANEAAGQLIFDKFMAENGLAPSDAASGGAVRGQLAAGSNTGKTVFRGASPRLGYTDEGDGPTRRRKALRGRRGGPDDDDDDGDGGYDIVTMLARLQQKRDELASQSAGIEERLEAQGVLVGHRGQNIFKIAHRNYRAFGKWRRATKVRVAARDGSLRGSDELTP